MSFYGKLIEGYYSHMDIAKQDPEIGDHHKNEKEVLDKAEKEYKDRHQKEENHQYNINDYKSN